MKDQSDNPSHHEQTLLPRSYISVPFRISTTFEQANASHIMTTFLFTHRTCPIEPFLIPFSAPQLVCTKPMVCINPGTGPYLQSGLIPWLGFFPLPNQKEWNVSFNDTLNTFYLWLYDIYGSITLIMRGLKWKTLKFTTSINNIKW